MNPKSKKIDFEKNLTELEAVVARMEQGDLSLEESLKEFERGISLTRACQQALADAEQRVTQLMADGRETPLDALDEEAEDGD